MNEKQNVLAKSARELRKGLGLTMNERQEFLTKADGLAKINRLEKQFVSEVKKIRASCGLDPYGHLMTITDPIGMIDDLIKDKKKGQDAIMKWRHEVGSLKNQVRELNAELANLHQYIQQVHAAQMAGTED